METYPCVLMFSLYFVYKTNLHKTLDNNLQYVHYYSFRQILSVLYANLKNTLSFNNILWLCTSLLFSYIVQSIQYALIFWHSCSLSFRLRLFLLIMYLLWLQNKSSIIIRNFPVLKLICTSISYLWSISTMSCFFAIYYKFDSCMAF